jgi:hypothetical protein
VRQRVVLEEMDAAVIIAAVMAGLVVLVTLGVFVWAAREDGRLQRKRDAARRFPRP